MKNNWIQKIIIWPQETLPFKNDKINRGNDFVQGEKVRLKSSQEAELLVFFLNCLFLFFGFTEADSSLGLT